jgi:hypothetical protein
MTYNIARAAGPVAAAASVEYLGIPASFLLNAGSYLVFVAALVITRPRPQEKAPRESSRLRDALPLLRDDPRPLRRRRGLPRLEHVGHDPAPARRERGAARTDHGAPGVAFLGLRPIASIADGAIASAAGVRTAGVILALPALAGAAVLVAFSVRQAPSQPRSPASLPS